MFAFTLTRAAVRGGVFLGILVTLVACGEAPPPPPMPPTSVIVDTVQRADLPLTMSFPARVVGSRVVDVRARVSGVVMERAYQEGQPVKEGDLLFRIEPDNYRALYDQAASQVAIQKAAIAQAQADFARIESLVRDGAVSRREFDVAESSLAQARAGLAGAEAALASARLSLRYTEVRAPVAGIASKEAVTVGNLVNGSAGAGGDLLTSIVQTEPAYVEFSMTEPEFLRMRELASALPEGQPLTVEVERGSRCAGIGDVDFTDSAVNTRTGTVRARAIFGNQDGCLVSGQFLAINVRGLILPDVLAMPKSAVLFGQAGAMAWVLDGENKVHPRPLRLGESWQDAWLVEDGLESGETVVVEGILKVRPDAVVAPERRPADVMGTAPAAADAGSPAPVEADADAGADASAGQGGD